MPEPEGASFFPFIDGAKWTYNWLNGAEKAGTVTLTCQVTTSAGGPPTAAFRMDTVGKDAKGNQQEVITNLDYTLYSDRLIDEDDKGITTTELEFPLTTGRTWKSDGATVSVGQQEVVASPFQVFQDAFKVTWTDPTDGITMNKWFASGVGLVHEATSFADGSSITLELTDFTKPSG